MKKKFMRTLFSGHGWIFIQLTAQEIVINLKHMFASCSGEMDSYGRKRRILSGWCKNVCLSKRLKKNSVVRWSTQRCWWSFQRWIYPIISESQTGSYGEMGESDSHRSMKREYYFHKRDWSWLVMLFLIHFLTCF